ncbi:DUF2207 domain-containing protein [Candidatus Micrarchaeota archaeon]|nr:DUF2207 domain-containing protein [Candidatus Micrarchaeota archaeon]
MLLLSSFSAAKSFYFPQVKLVYNVSDDASIAVREELTFDFSGSFSFAYRDLPDGEWSYSNIGVFETTDGANQPVDFSAYGEDGSTRVRWNFKASDEKRTFVIVYTLKNAVVSYDDAYEFYWKLWGEQWDAVVEKLEAKIVFPRALYSGSQVWLHPALDATYNLQGDSLEIQANGIPSYTFLEFRVLFNKEALAGGFARVVSGSGYNKVESEENFNEFVYAASEYLWLWPIAVFLALAFGFYHYYNKYGREPRKAQVRKERDFLYDDRTWEVEYLLTQSTSVASMTASLLDLARRGHVKIEKTKSTGLIFKKDDYLLSKARGKDSLHEFEKWLIGEVFQKDGGSCDSIKTSEIAVEHSRDSTSMASQWSSMTKKEIEGECGFAQKLLDKTGKIMFNKLQISLILLTLLASLFISANALVNGFIGKTVLVIAFFVALVLAVSAGRKFLGKTPSSGNSSYSPGTTVVATFGAGMVMLFTSIPFFVIPSIAFYAALLVNVLFAVIDYKFKFTLTRFTEEGEKHYEAWRGLHSFLDEVPTFKRKTPPEIVLWEKYLVYAVIFGNADRVAKAMS